MANPSGRMRGRPKSFHDKSSESVIQSLDRAMEVLKIVASGGGLSLTDIAATGGQSAATCYRVLTTLKKHRIVEFDETTQLWHVGLEAFRIGTRFLARTRMAEVSRPVMQRIMNETGETANLAILDHAEVIFVSQVETHEPIRAFFPPGTHGPAHASGIGKAILANLPADTVGRLVGEDLPRYTAATIATRTDLLTELDRIRARGFAIDDEERTEGMRCIAAPVFNAHGEPVAGISLSGPSVRVRPERDAELGNLIRRAADEITLATGGALPRV